MLGGRAAARAAAVALALLLIAVAAPAWAFPAPAGATRTPAAVPGDLCTTEQWRKDFRRCVGKLADVGQAPAQCLKAPTPAAPDSGLAGWFAERPDTDPKSSVSGYYSLYGYAGYNYTTYDIGCV